MTSRVPTTVTTVSQESRGGFGFGALGGGSGRQTPCLIEDVTVGDIAGLPVGLVGG